MEALAAEIALSETSNRKRQSLLLAPLHLAKADLVSQAVVEFTSQQGVMGQLLRSRREERSAAAIREQILAFAGDRLPSGQVGRCYADKLDTICGMLLSTSRQPALPILTLFVVQQLASCAGPFYINLDLKKLIASSGLYRQQGLAVGSESVQSQVEQYFISRHLLLRTEDLCRCY